MLLRRGVRFETGKIVFVGEVRDQIEARVRRFLVERRYKPVLELSGRGATADR